MTVETGIKLTTWKAIKNPPYPAEGAGNQTLNFTHLLAAVIGIPLFTAYYFCLGFYTCLILFFPLGVSVFGLFLFISSRISSPYNNKVQLPGKKVEEYFKVRDENLSKYVGRNKIPMEIFFENYFDDKIDLCGDALEILEVRHDWASFEIGLGQAKFFITQWIPETLWHSKKQDEDQVRDHYDRGDDFYEAFLGETMVYTSGIISDPNKSETLEEIQKNKLKFVCEKMKFKSGERHLDIGCGWGTLVAYAAKNYGVDSTGITLGKNQTEFGNNRIKDYGVDSGQARIVCMDYRDIPSRPKYNKITCLEMAEHVGVRHFSTFLAQVRDMLEDDGMFFLQIAGLRRTWQYEDFIWGLFMAKYIFPGADASCPLNWFVNQLECAGFEIYNIDTIGVHYSGTIYRWYKNWLENREKITAKYGKSATCYQIVAHKNFNAFDRASLIPQRFVA
ncbi:2726_t:CDS:2 [Diversispora eburnea]|uniref:sphingolipid C(9)-methyltransferase n=1 Tax=Diversispora eburnea TaxID=1213867 RepID=A0A9N9AKB2_9GLOM|nr:2726_t:CDS:2 [Diversispora eburnea]